MVSVFLQQKKNNLSLTHIIFLFRQDVIKDETSALPVLIRHLVFRGPCWKVGSCTQHSLAMAARGSHWYNLPGYCFCDWSHWCSWSRFTTVKTVSTLYNLLLIWTNVEKHDPNPGACARACTAKNTQVITAPNKFYKATFMTKSWTYVPIPRLDFHRLCRTSWFDFHKRWCSNLGKFRCTFNNETES